MLCGDVCLLAGVLAEVVEFVGFTERLSLRVLPAARAVAQDEFPVPVADGEGAVGGVVDDGGALEGGGSALEERKPAEAVFGGVFGERLSDDGGAGGEKVGVANGGVAGAAAMLLRGDPRGLRCGVDGAFEPEEAGAGVLIEGGAE